jgi:hypothetical protein
MLLLRIALLSAALALPSPAALAQAKVTPKDALLYIVLPEDGATVKGAFWCRFGLRNMGVAPAGHDFPNTGHHHLLIDTKEAINPNEPIPHDKKHLHFGGGETEVLLDLPPGEHTLQLVLSDADHFSFNPPLISKRITITVKSDDDGDDNKRSRHRSYHRIHWTRFANVRKDHQNDKHDGCSYRDLLGLFKGCQQSASTSAKPPAE